MSIRERTVQANGLDLAFLEMGVGRTVLLLHGFPDTPWSWEHQMPALSDAGYRVIAPFMRGYAPSEAPADGSYDFTTLGHDVVGLIQALDIDEPCYAVGHDIGALQLQAAVAGAPELFDRPVFVSVNHSATASGVVLIPRLAHRSFHLWLLAHEGLNEVVAGFDDMALIDYLWELWSPPDQDYAEHLARVRETLSCEGSLKAAVSVYPSFISPGITEAMRRPLDLPAMVLYGSEDVLPVTLTKGEEQHHTAGFRREVLEGALHWPHRERSERFNEVLLEWLGAAEAPVHQPTRGRRT